MSNNFLVLTQSSRLMANSAISSSADSVAVYTPSTSSESPTEVEQTHPVLVNTFKTFDDFGKVRVYRDGKGLYRHYQSDDDELDITHVVNIKLSFSLMELKDAINDGVSEHSDRMKLPGGHLAQARVRDIEIERVEAHWHLPGGQCGHTIINEGNCGQLLKLIAARGWKDMLVAFYTWIRKVRAV